VDLALATIGLLDRGIQTFMQAGVMSTPMPSPSMKPRIGWSETTSLPFSIRTLSP
jgi:hypothetical protein